jgi:hypothetical protein
MVVATVDYEPRSATVVIANAILITFMSIFVLIRFWARVFLLHQVGLDDSESFPPFLF